MWAVYAASKLQSEQACFNFVKEKKPGFVLNTVLPNYAMGEILDPRQPGSSGGIIRAAWKGQAVPIFVNFPPQYMVDVKDIGRLHVRRWWSRTCRMSASSPFHSPSVRRLCVC
jgi:nucleoside-diphosphate-sugar epimerase